MTDRIHTVLGELLPLLAAAEGPMADEFTSIVAAALEGRTDAAAAPFPLDDEPDLAPLASPTTLAATRAVVAAPLPWQQPPTDVVPPGWAHRAAACELIGPDGAIAGQGPERFGLFYLAADLDYPDHWHDAEEFYLVLAGSAEWTVAGATDHHGAGGWSHTPTKAVHRIVTRDQPLLAAWGWAGDTSYDSYGY